MKSRVFDRRAIMLWTIAVCVVSLSVPLAAVAESPESPGAQPASAVAASASTEAVSPAERPTDPPSSVDFGGLSFGAEPTFVSSCSATAQCQIGSVSCSGACLSNAVDSSCTPGQPEVVGYAKCGNVTKWCAPCVDCDMSGEPCDVDSDCHFFSGCENCTCEGSRLRFCSCP